MKAHFHKVSVDTTAAFHIRHDTKPNFGTVWHYHPELELHYVIQGEGVRFIGDNVSFQPEKFSYWARIYPTPGGVIKNIFRKGLIYRSKRL